MKEPVRDYRPLVEEVMTAPTNPPQQTDTAAVSDLEGRHLDDIAEMMGEFVDNWPQPKKVSTALKLVAKVIRTLMDPPKHRYWGAGEDGCPDEIKAGNGEIHTLRCKVCGQDSPRDQRCLDGLTEYLDNAPADALAAKDAEIARLLAENEWRPIETAPKDGSWVWTWGQYFGLARFAPEFPDDPWDGATHWRPMPAGPSA